MNRAAWSFCLVCLLGLATTAPLAGQTPDGALTGIVFDSISGEPLEGATVILSGSDRTGTTDEEGRFRIDDLPAGTYLVGFLHPMLDELGLDAAAVEVEIVEGRESEVWLATPSLGAIVAHSCLAAGAPPGSAVMGSVRTPDGEVAMPGATVTLSWEEGRRTTETDASGAFLFCGVPPDVTVMLDATFVGVSATPVTLELDGPLAVVQDLEMALPDANIEDLERQADVETGTDPIEVRGLLVGLPDGTPVGGATVRLGDADVEAVTDPDGAFVFENLRPGTYQLRVQHDRYGSRSRFVDLTGGPIVDLRVEMPAEDVITLEGITVEATARTPEGEVVRRAGTRRDIFAGETLARAEERGARVIDVLRMTPGIRVAEGGVGAGIPFGTVCVELRRALRGIITGGDCQFPLLILDGTRFAGDAAGEVLYTLNVADYESIEVIPPMMAGVRFGTAGSAGAIVIHSRGRGPYQADSRAPGPR